MGFFSEINAIHEVDLPENYDKLSDEKKKILCDWIRENFLPRKTANRNHTSYKLKHFFQNDRGGFYTNNGQFKGAMRACGFEPVDPEEKNWCFRISQRSPVFKKNLRSF